MPLKNNICDFFILIFSIFPIYLFDKLLLLVLALVLYFLSTIENTCTTDAYIYYEKYHE